MQVDSELLGSCGLLLEKTVYSSGSYSLHRVKYRDRELVAEVTATGGVFQHRWPSVKNLVTPVSARDLPGSRKLLLFDVQGSSLREIMDQRGGFSPEAALDIAGKVLRILTDLQSAGLIAGYIGPEMFFLNDSGLFMLAGRRGVPVSPFTPGETEGVRPSDPRSDVSAMGSFLFRLISGTDDRKLQLERWNNLEPAFRKAIQSMVAAEPVDRPGSLREVAGILGKLADSHCEEGKKEESSSSSETFIRKKEKVSSGSKRFNPKYLLIPVVLILAYLVFRFSAPPPEETSDFTIDAGIDTLVQESTPVTPVTGVQEEAMPDSSLHPSTNQVALVDTVRVWVSNGTGEEGLENSFRADPLGDFSWVYPLESTTRRRTSLVTARRAEVFTDYRETELWRKALEVAGADTAFSVSPVDLTIMLGTDLRYAGVNSYLLPAPSGAVSDTLFVDVVNHGIQYALDGLGAATYVGRILDGRSCTIDGIQYVIQIIDVRDADGYHEEIGIPEFLEETMFLRRESNGTAEELEDLIRQYIQALPESGGIPVQDIPVPHLHILLGKP